MRLLLILISLLFFSCGTRRTELEASKTKVSASSSKTTDIDIKNDIKKNVAVSAAESSKTAEKDVELIEEFGENGQLKKRVYRERYRQKEHRYAKDSVGATIDKGIAKARKIEKNKTDSLSKTKDKKIIADKTVATNVGGPWPLIIVVSILAVIAGIVFLLHKKKLI